MAAVTRLGTFLNPGRSLATAVDLARRAEELGYESVWVTHGGGRDSFVVLSAYGAATRRVAVGNGVVPIYPRHPTAMAQAALTLSELTGGRFRLRRFARLLCSIARPARVLMRARNPCLRLRRRFFGWKVRLVIALVHP